MVTPHADDETIGAGATIARHTRLGGEALVLCITADDARREELAAACAVLGADYDVLFPGTFDSRLDAVALRELVEPIEKLVQWYNPQGVVMPAPSAHHQDHQRTAQACIAAMRPGGTTDWWRPDVVLSADTAGDHWGAGEPDRPTAYIEVTEADVERKVEAMAAHASQARPIPSDRSPEAMRALLRLRGSQAGVAWAEAFEVRRWLVR